MDGMVLDRDCAVHPVKRTDHLIMVARDVDNARAFARLAQDLLDDAVMRLRPVTAPAHLPDINEIAHDIEPLEIVFPQKIEQPGSAAPACPQMNIGNPGGPHLNSSFFVAAKRL
jgi:hypothetical protein